MSSSGRAILHSGPSNRQEPPENVQVSQPLVPHTSRRYTHSQLRTVRTNLGLAISPAGPKSDLKPLTRAVGEIETILPGARGRAVAEFPLGTKITLVQHENAWVVKFDPMSSDLVIPDRVAPSLEAALSWIKTQQPVTDPDA